MYNKPIFTHVINPFAAPKDREHAIASQITYASLLEAAERAKQAGLKVEVRAVICSEDEGVVAPPVTKTLYLSRTIQDLHKFKPIRYFPLFDDILRVGSKGIEEGYLIYTNMDISVQPCFYLQLSDIVNKKFKNNEPFIIYRRNISERYSKVEELTEMYNEEGRVGYGYDCFVFPIEYLEDVDVGNCCIGAPYFDFLFGMCLDAASGYRLQRIRNMALTFHIGNEISWVKNMQYIEHNLSESLRSIERMRNKWTIPEDSIFFRMEKRQFRAHATFRSRLFRKIKTIGVIGEMLHKLKKFFRMSH